MINVIPHESVSAFEVWHYMNDQVDSFARFYLNCQSLDFSKNSVIDSRNKFKIIN
jgi:hypothetical protein